jgi:hypothetical protein
MSEFIYEQISLSLLPISVMVEKKMYAYKYIELVTKYENLVNVTENFTNNTVHAKCKNFKKIIFPKEFRRIIIGKNFSTYFPCLKYQ